MPDLDSLSGPDISSGAGGEADAAGSGQGGSAGSGGTSGSAGSAGAAGSSGSTGTGGTAGTGVVQPTPQVRYDFEEPGLLGLDGWVAVGDQRPPDVQDAVEQSTEAAHSGSGALRVVFNGEATVPDAGEASPWYGVYKVGSVPANYEVNLWMMATTPGVSAELYAQTTQAYLWNVLGSASLPVGEWTSITVIVPAEVMQWGIKLLSPFDAEGYVYLDEVTW